MCQDDVGNKTYSKNTHYIFFMDIINNNYNIAQEKPRICLSIHYIFVAVYNLMYHYTFK